VEKIGTPDNDHAWDRSPHRLQVVITGHINHQGQQTDPLNMGHTGADFREVGILSDQQKIGFSELCHNNADNTQHNAIGQCTTPNLSGFCNPTRTAQVAGFHHSSEHQSDATDQQEDESRGSQAITAHFFRPQWPQHDGIGQRQGQNAGTADNHRPGKTE